MHVAAPTLCDSNCSLHQSVTHIGFEGLSQNEVLAPGPHRRVQGSLSAELLVHDMSLPGTLTVCGLCRSLRYLGVSPAASVMHLKTGPHLEVRAAACLFGYRVCFEAGWLCLQSCCAAQANV